MRLPKPENFVKIVAEYFHIDSYFDEMVGSEPEGRRTNKTEVIEETLKRLGFSEHRDQVIMVGDKEHDVFGARRAGLECNCSFLWLRNRGRTEKCPSL